MYPCAWVFSLERLRQVWLPRQDLLDLGEVLLRVRVALLERVHLGSKIGHRLLFSRLLGGHHGKPVHEHHGLEGVLFPPGFDGLLERDRVADLDCEVGGLGGVLLDHLGPVDARDHALALELLLEVGELLLQVPELSEL